MSTEQALLALLACLALGTLALVFVAQARLTGSVKLELDLGARPLERALRERDQARAQAEEWRNTATTVTSQVTQTFRTAPLNPEAKVTVNGEDLTALQENDPEFLAELERKFNESRK